MDSDGRNIALQSALARAAEVKKKRVGDECENAYTGNLRRMGKWLELMGWPNLVESGADNPLRGCPIVPLDEEKIFAFFGAVTEKRDESHPIFGKTPKSILANGGFVSPSTLQGYKSSLRWLYLEKGEPQ